MSTRNGDRCLTKTLASMVGALCLFGTVSSYGGTTAATGPVLLLAIGDSLVHGTMDARNNADSTLNAFVQRVANSLGQVVDLKFSQPLYDDAENRLYPYKVPSNYGVDGSDLFSAEGLEYYSRVGASESYVTGAYLADQVQPVNFDDDYDKVLFPINVFLDKATSQIDALIWAISRNGAQAAPWDAGVLFWLGNNDSSLAALGAGGENPAYLSIPYQAIRSRLSLEVRALVDFGVLTGALSFSPYTEAAINRNLTSASDFSVQLTHLLKRVRDESVPGDARLRLFLMSLPYYSAVGYLLDSEDLEFYLRKLNGAYSVPASFARVAPAGEPITDPFAGDRVSLLTFAMMYAMLSTGFSVDDVNAILEQDGLVMSEAEQQIIMSRIDEFNAAIEAVASGPDPRLQFIDTGTYLNALLSGESPIAVGDRTLSRKWVRGNAFSLDGVHPGYTGQALIANYVLEQIEPLIGVDLPLEDLETVLASDPYVDGDGDGWAPGPSAPASGATELMYLFKDPDDTDASVEASIPSNVWDMISDLLLDELLTVDTIRAEAVRRGIAVDR